MSAPPVPAATLRAERLAPFAFALIAAAPIAYMALQVARYSRDIAYWDDIECVIGFLLRLDEGKGFWTDLANFFAVTNEHRTVTSRLLFATSYWLTGTVNFHVIGVIGNLFILGFCGLCLWAAGTLARRVRLGVVLAFLFFQLGHFENFLWSGASIDHFQVVLLAGGALILVARDSRRATLAGALLAALATFTLVHGSLAWVVGAALLAHRRRWGWLAWWSGAAAAMLAVFFYGFHFNEGHRIVAVDLASLGRRAWYFLSLLGTPVAVGAAGAAPWLGLGLLGAYGYFGVRRAAAREPIAAALAVFAIGSLALVAYGRAEANGGVVHSRYMVLAALAWAMLLFLILETLATADRPYRWLWRALPALVIFNVSANRAYALAAEGSVEIRDRAATRFKQYGQDGKGIFNLHPIPGFAESILQRADARGIYRLPRFSQLREFGTARENARMITYLDEKLINDRAVTLGGWAMLPDVESRRGQIHVVLASPSSHLVFSTVTLQRPDVAKVYKEPRWRLCGFRFLASRERLPAERLQVGLIVVHDGRAERHMTDQWIDLSVPGEHVPGVGPLAKED
ncbi:MAG: hypothetical protein RLZZ15_3811 [Verrucomicrobiota bacterium]|jgi:hypothetical protein